MQLENTAAIHSKSGSPWCPDSANNFEKDGLRMQKLPSFTVCRDKTAISLKLCSVTAKNIDKNI